MENMINQYFCIEERSSCISQEVRAGITCFLTMSYILLVNAQVLNVIGVKASDIVIGTSLSSGAGTMICGLFGNLPFGLAPGIGLSAYLAYGLVLENGLTLSQAFTSCFISGILLSVLSALGISHFIMDYIPKSVKVSTIVGMGLQICLAGFTSVKIVVANKHSIVAMGSLYKSNTLLACFGLIIIGSLIYHKVKGAILIGVITISLITWFLNDSFPAQFISYPVIETQVFDLIRIDNFDIVKMGPAIVSFLFIGVVDVSGIVFGMSSLAKITKPDGHIPGSIYAFLGCGFGTMIGAASCSTPVIVYVESAAGIKDGGKTGLTAVVISTLFFLSVFFAPLFSQVPSAATAPVSVLIGVMLMSHATEIDWDDMSEAIPSFLTLIIMPFTFSITNGIMFGLVSSFCFYITTGRAFHDIHNYLTNSRDEPSSEDRKPLHDSTVAVEYGSVHLLDT